MNVPKETTLEGFQKQQTVLIVINIAVIAALFAVHIVFLSEIGPPSRILLATLSVRFVILIIELAWIQRLTGEVGGAARAGYTSIAIWLNIAFAFVASSFGGTADSHYSVLMVIPIVQAAYGLSLPRTLAVVTVAVVLTFLEVWIFFQRRPPVDFGEFFEAATVSLIFYVIAVVVWLLVGSLRSEQAKLKESLSRLEEAHERLIAEEKLAAVGQLSGAIAHEIRNPVAMISASLEMALKQPPDSSVRAEMFEIATREFKRLETLTGDFLAFARTKPPEAVPADPTETLEYVAALVRARMETAGLELEVGPAAIRSAEYDPAQVNQALLNLVLNAVDATPAGGSVRIGMSGPDEFFVENSGPAIAPEIEARLFEPFFTSKPRGTGLGLAIVRNIARAHGGEAYLSSNKDGAVRFSIRLGRRSNGESSDSRR